MTAPIARRLRHQVGVGGIDRQRATGELECGWVVRASFHDAAVYKASPATVNDHDPSAAGEADRSRDCLQMMSRIAKFQGGSLDALVDEM